MAEDRISRLSKRFETHAVGRQASTQRSRERKSFYLDAELVGRLDRTYRDVGHELYPVRSASRPSSKPCLSTGSNTSHELKSALVRHSDTGDTSPTS